jgi:hypothetical protein
VQVGDVGGPGWGLVLTHTGDNGHKARSVGWVQQSETTACRINIDRGSVGDVGLVSL